MLVTEAQGKTNHPRTAVIRSVAFCRVLRLCPAFRRAFRRASGAARTAAVADAPEDLQGNDVGLLDTPCVATFFQHV